jgi:hypothetical protein
VDAAGIELGEHLGEMHQATTDAVELVARERVALIAGIQRALQHGPVMPGTGGPLDVDVGFSDPQAARRIDLQVEALILGAHAAVEDDLAGHLCPFLLAVDFDSTE